VTTTTAPASGQQAAAPLKADRWSRNYFDAQGRRHAAHVPVPLDGNGEICGKAFKCRKCSEPTWKPLGFKGTPACPFHEVKMVPFVLRRPPLLPYRALWDVCEKPLRPVWGLPGMAAIGFAVDAGNVPALAGAAAIPVAGLAAARGYRWWQIRQAAAKNKLDRADEQHGKKLRAAIDKASRTVGYSAIGGTAWMTAVAALGLDPSTTAGKIALTLTLPVWAFPAATWWVAQRRVTPPEPVVVESVPEPEIDRDEAMVMQLWRDRVAFRPGDVVDVGADGQPIKATVSGRLPGARLVGWRRIRGGWAATIIGPAGVFESDNFLQAKGKIASAFSVTKAMVSLVPDAEDENRCGLFVQKASVIGEAVPWAGPDSIDVEKGVAPLVRYIDGTYGMYEIFRPGWGCPQELYIGTTGSAKSSTLQQVFAIDRWAHHTDVQGVKRGIVADFLIDPQQGQSFGEFADDLAAPVASSLDEAMMLVRAFRREMLRRNKYLSRKAWVDDKGRPRRGAKWWNPLVDGTMLFLTIDEAHEFLAVREFAALITAGARMYRKCGMKFRVATHTPLLSDLGGSMALRDMLTGGFVWCGRTANGLSGPTAFNGRLPADPKTIPEVPGAAYILSAIEKKPMLARTMYEDDYYDYVRDADNNPIGFPGELSAETLAAFGQEYADWLEFMASESADDGLWVPGGAADPVKVEQSSDASVQEYLRDMVLWALTAATEPMDMNGLDEALRSAEVQASTLAVRDVLAAFRGQGVAVTGSDGRHALSPQKRAEVEAQLREAQAQVDAMIEQEQVA
jgi:hypothetical protein